jgi:hypothetical protein
MAFIALATSTSTSEYPCGGVVCAAWERSRTRDTCRFSCHSGSGRGRACMVESDGMLVAKVNGRRNQVCVTSSVTVIQWSFQLKL